MQRLKLFRRLSDKGKHLKSNIKIKKMENRREKREMKYPNDNLCKKRE